MVRRVRGGGESLIALALLALVAAVYGRAAGLDFVGLDDNLHVYQNPQVKAGLTADTIAWSLTTFAASNWHPLTWLSHALDVELFGLDPAWHHLVNVALHGGNVLLLFLLLRRLTGQPLRSAAVAALFAVHPLNVESVAWVAERKNVLSTGFWLLATLAYTGYVRRPSTWRYAAALLLFTLGLSAKPMLVTLPLTLLLLDGWPLGRFAAAGRGAGLPVPVFRRLAALSVEKLPFLALSAISSTLTILAQRSGGALMEAQAYPLVRAANAAVSYAAYLRQALWPAGLAVFYPHPGPGLSGWKVAGAALLLAAAAILAVAQFRRRPYLAVGWAWYLTTLLPVIGIVQVGRQALADRYAYVPLIGVFVAAVWAVSELAAALPRALRARVLAAAVCTPLAALSLCAGRQVVFWRDEISLFERALAVTENNDYIHALIALPLFRQGRVDATLWHLQQSLRINPANDAVQSNVGLILLDQGRRAEAAAHLRAALRLNPANAKAHFNLARTLVAEGRRPEARAHLLEAVRLEPGYENPRRLLAEIDGRGESGR